MHTDRLDAFSDGVFAIAITLLALELPRPEGDELWHALGHAWESYASFIISFLTIGIIWLNHHALFDRIARADRTLLLLNVLLLMWVSIIPWPTGLVADHLSGGGAAAATAIYCAVFVGADGGPGRPPGPPQLAGDRLLHGRGGDRLRRARGEPRDLLRAGRLLRAARPGRRSELTAPRTL